MSTIQLLTAAGPVLLTLLLACVAIEPVQVSRFLSWVTRASSWNECKAARLAADLLQDVREGVGYTWAITLDEVHSKVVAALLFPWVFGIGLAILAVRTVFHLLVPVRRKAR